MMPVPAGQFPLTEEEYWRDYEIIRNDVNAAMVSCYTHRTITLIVASDSDLAMRVNRHPDFWRITSFSLQNSLFIVLARILDSDPRLHSIYQVLNATTAHPEFFSKAALRARKLAVPGTEPNPPWLDEYVENAWEPTVRDLRALRKALGPHKTKFEEIYKPIRNQIAHIIFKDDQSIEALYRKTLKADIDEILCFLHNVLRAIWFLAYNAEPPNLHGDNYGYFGRVRAITGDTEEMLRTLP
ncbi:hypothetical protein [Paludibaculum fermentans]|uniref:AbiU2 domain-containing protein n=1 Tax=Paludibaculum fermentans TaxID=1473598 RepID=UPI003EBC4BD7